MANSSTQVRVINTQPTFLTTPKVFGPKAADADKNSLPPMKFPAHRLQPGGNNMEAEHVAALDALDPKSGPGKVWRQWRVTNAVRVLKGKAAQVETRKPEGPEAPKTLTEYRVDQAEAIIGMETSIEVLQRWLDAERRNAVKTAIRARLTVLAGGSGSDGAGPSDVDLEELDKQAAQELGPQE